MRAGAASPGGRRWWSVCLLAGTGLSLVAGACGGEPSRDGARADRVRLPVADVHVAYAFNPSDKRQLARFEDNVFLGRVDRRLGTLGARTSDPETTVPQTQVRVAVIDNVKGRLTGAVTVNQYGGPVEAKRGRVGTRPPGPVLELWEGDPLLRPGEVVMLATRRNPDHGWHTIVAQPFGDRRVASRAHRRALVREFEQAAGTPRRG